MFKWLKSKKQARIEQLEVKVKRLQEHRAWPANINCMQVAELKMQVEQNKTLADNLAHANKYQRDMIGKGLGQVGKQWTAEKIYIARLLKEYHDAGDARVILNGVYQSNHSVDAIQKAIKRWDKKGAK